MRFLFFFHLFIYLFIYFWKNEFEIRFSQVFSHHMTTLNTFYFRGCLACTFELTNDLIDDSQPRAIYVKRSQITFDQPPSVTVYQVVGFSFAQFHFFNHLKRLSSFFLSYGNGLLKTYALSMENKMAAGAFGRARNYG